MTVNKKKVLVITLFCLVCVVCLLGCMTTVPSITFETDGGSKIFDLSITENVIKVRDNTIKFVDLGDRLPTKNGYTFDGWYTDEALTVAFDDTVIPKESITLYAKWNPNPILVTFVADEEVVVTLEIPYGTALPMEDLPVVPMKAGYSGSWNLTKINVSSVVAPITVKALYIERLYTYTFETNGGNTLNNVSAYYNTAFTKPANPTRVGYVFAGWYLDSSFLTLYEFPTVMPSSDVILYARWIRDTDLISYFDYEVVNGAIRITDLVGDGRFQSILYIPERINGMIVKYLGYNDYTFGDIVTETGVDKEKFDRCNVFASTSLSNVIIPAGVEYVGSFAFADCAALRRVQFADGSVVSLIGVGAFSGCNNLSTFAVPRSVSVIDSYAFGYSINYTQTLDAQGNPVPKPMTRLYEVSFPSDSALLRMGDNIFDGTISFARITLPASLPSFNWKAFLGSAVVAVGIDENNPYYMSVDGVVFSKSRRDGEVRAEALVYYPEWGEKSYSVPEGVTSIAGYAFCQNKAIESLTVSASVTYIGTAAFSASTLNTITFARGSALQEVGAYAFEKVAVKNIEFPANLVYLREGAFMDSVLLEIVSFTATASGQEALTVISDKAFKNCSALIEFTVPSSVERIGNDAFNGCIALKALTFNTLTSEYNASLTEIGDRAFYECVSITALELPKSLLKIGAYAFAGETRMIIGSVSYIGQICRVTEIGEYAFKNCANITSITIPATIQVLGEGCYYGCSAINSLNFESGIVLLSDIPVKAFYGCSSISRLRLPSSIVEIKEGAFRNCTRLETLEISTGASGSKLRIIGESAFENCLRLASTAETASAQLILPSMVTTVRERAFYGCANLDYVSIPAGLSDLAEYAFGGCTKLSSVRIAQNSNLSYLSDNLFYGCSSLESFLVPSTIVTINGDPFNECTSLAAFTINDGCPVYYVSNGILFNAAKNRLILYPKSKAGSYSISAAVTEIAPYAFHNSKISTLDFDLGEMLSIGEYAFADCATLVAVTLKPRVTNIGSYSFSNCSSLSSVDITEVVGGSPLVIGDYAFERSFFESITIRSRVSQLGKYAFAENLNLKTVNIEGGNALLKLEEGTFYKCKSIETISLPVRVESVGKNTFAWCTSLESIYFEEQEGYTLSLGEKSFSNCHRLLSLELPGTLVEMGKEAFSYNSHLEKVTFKPILDGIISNDEYADTLFGVGESAFVGCGVLREVYISNTVNYIGDYAFYNCDSLAVIDFEEENGNISDISVGSYAFAYADGMKSFVIPSRVVELKDYALYHNGMTEIVFNDSENELILGSSVFSESALSAVELPERIKELSDFAFKGCALLKAVTFSETSGLVLIGEGAFEETTFTDIAFPSGLREIGKDAFKGDVYLHNVIYNDGLERIMEGAFSGCTDIVALVLPRTVLYLGDSAFFGCSKLVSIGLDETSLLENLGSYVFSNCTGLTSLYIGKQVAVIGDAPAYNCKSLTSLDVHTENPYFHSVSNVLYTRNDSLLIQYSAGKVGSNYTVSAQTNILGKGSFIGNTYLTSINIESQNLVLRADDVFNETSSYLQFFVAPTYLSNYKQALHWKELSNKIVSIDSQYENYVIEELSDDGMSCRIIKYTGGDSSPANLTIPTNINGLKVKEIGEYAFQGSSSLVNLTLPQGIHTIGRYAFANCVNLTTVNTCVSLKTIGNYAFANCVSLTTVAFGEKSFVNAIPDYCFFNCTNLESVTIPEKTLTVGAFAFAGENSSVSMRLSEVLYEGTSQLSSFGNNAFQYCSALSEITMPSSVSLLGKNLFLGCTALLSLTLERTAVEGVTELADSSVFMGVKDEFSIFVPALARKNYLTAKYWKEQGFSIIASNLTFENYAIEIVEGNDVCLIKYMGISREVEVLSEIAGYNVIAIGENSFGYNLVSLYLPDSIRYIEQNAFKYAENLERISLPKGLKSIGAGAFRGLSSLTTVEFRGDTSSELASIGDYAFYNCTGLTGFHFYINVTEIGQSAFAGDSDTPMNISEITFYGSNLAVIDETNSLKIGAYAFRNCNKLLSVELPNNLVSMGDGVFADCNSLFAVYLRKSDSSNTIVTLDGDGPNLFLNCSFVRVYVAATKLNAYTARLTSSWYRNHSNRISSIANIVDGGFSIKQTGTSANPAITIVQYLGREENIVIPSAVDGKPVTALGTRIIGNRVRKVTLPDTLLSIGENSFYGATALREVIFSGNFSATSIDKQAFFGCTSLVSMNLPTSVTIIGQAAFQNSGLESFDITEALSYPAGFSISIEDNAFNNCDNLVSVTLTNMVKSIGSYTFAYCDKLTNVSLNQDLDSMLTNINQYAFAGCSELTEIVIPSSVSNLGNGVFNSCGKLAKVYCRKGNDGLTNTGEPPRAGSSMFANIANPFLKIYVPSGSTTNYRGATNWMAYSDMIISEQSVPCMINEEQVGTFDIMVDESQNVKLTGYNGTAKVLEIPARVTLATRLYNVTSIGRYFGNQTLETIIVPSTISTIDPYAFASMSALTKVTLPAELENVGEYAFAYSEKLKQVNIPTSLAQISDGMFRGCTSLREVSLPESITIINRFAFDGCTSLVRLIIKSINSVDVSPIIGSANMLTNTSEELCIFVANTSLAKRYNSATNWNIDSLLGRYYTIDNIYGDYALTYVTETKDNVTTVLGVKVVQIISEYDEIILMDKLGGYDVIGVADNAVISRIKKLIVHGTAEKIDVGEQKCEVEYLAPEPQEAVEP